MKVVTACTHNCPDACSCVVDDEKRKISGNPDHPITSGVVCSKVRNYFERLDSPDRITGPLLRKDGGEFEPVSWDEALELCAKRLQPLLSRPESILHIHGHSYRGVFAQASKAFFEALSSSSLYGSNCDNAGIQAMIRCCGSLQINDPEDMLNARRIVNWGRDLSRSSIHSGMMVKKARKKGIEVLTVTVGDDGNKGYSDETIRIRPGTDRFLAAAVIKLFVESGMLEQGVITRTSNWPVFRGLIDSLSLEELCAACDVTTKDVEMLFDWYAQPGAVATIVGWGLQRYLSGGENVSFIASLVMLAGHMGRKGGGASYSIPSSRNLTSWKAETDAPSQKRRKMLRPALGAEMLRADPPVEFAFVDGTNIVNQVPDSIAMAMAMDECPFVVVVDGFMTDTARSADLILPPVFMFERDEIVGSSMHHFVNYSRKAVEGPEGCRDIYDILADLGERLNPPVSFPSRGACVNSALEHSGIGVEELSTTGFCRSKWPMVAFEGMRFDTSDGRFLLPETLTPEPDATSDFPLQILSLVRGRYAQSQMPESEQRGIPTVRISVDNPQLESLDPKKDVFLVTPQGSMQVLVECVEDLHPNAVVFRRGGWMSFGQSPNPIIEPKITDMGDTAAYYSQRARLENRSQ